MNKIFRAKACGQLHLLETGEPIAHACSKQFDPSLHEEASVTRADNPVPLKIHSRIDPDEMAPAPDGLSSELRDPSYFRRSMNPVETSAKPTRVPQDQFKSMAASKDRFQLRRPQREYAHNPVCPIAQPSAVPSRELADNPVPKSLDECEVNDSASNPVEDTDARRCDILRMRHKSKNPHAGEVSCDQLERNEGHSYDQLLVKSLMALTPEKREALIQKQPKYGEILRRYPEALRGTKNYASNPVSSEVIAEAKAMKSQPVASPASVNATVPASEKVLHGPSKPKAEKEVTSKENEPWRSRRIPISQGMQFVLRMIPVQSRAYPYMARIKAERDKKVSLSMIDFALKDLEKMIPSFKGEDAKHAKALLHDLNLCRKSWKERATIVVDGMDRSMYPVDESKIPV